MTDIESRLQNWANVVRDSIKQGVSITGLLCDRLRINARKPNSPMNWDEDRFLKKRDPLDYQDGWLIEVAMRKLSIKNRDLLRLVYTQRMHPNIVCNKLFLRKSEFDSYLYKAQDELLAHLDKRDLASTLELKIMVLKEKFR